MEESDLRQLEKQFKIRVKTGCETCRIRRVKCDEAKPECTRCTKTGRKCGYTRSTKLRKGSPAAAASYRNSSFLVVPQRPTQIIVSRNPSQSLSPVPQENRSFHYFRTHTLPRWTEYFDSELWSEKVLQLSHSEPAIKHGLLALSTMHECFENASPVFIAKSGHFAFSQYMQAVKHSNNLLTAHQEGKVELEKILIACLIFTCYENLAGNYQAANMHLRNGLRILNQHKLDAKMQHALSYESIGNVLYRFDLQAMTFSVSNSPYEYDMDVPPGSPSIPETYTSNAVARDDLVKLVRCIFWLSGVADENPSAKEHPRWSHIYSQVIGSLQVWEARFVNYQQNLPQHEQGDNKIEAGNTLLKMYAIVTRIIAVAQIGNTTEMIWDSFVDSFRTVVGLAETLSTSQPCLPHLSRSSALLVRQHPQPAKHRPIAPKPSRNTSPAPPGAATMVFRSEPSPLPSPFEAQRGLDEASVSERVPSSFSPSFELSAIVPLFLVASRCRDPVIRRRAIALLLNFRRREGVWDSLGAGMVATECLRMEEGLDHAELDQNGWLPLSPTYRECKDVPEWRRVQNIFLNIVEGHMNVTYEKTNGDRREEKRPLLGIVEIKGLDRRSVLGSQQASTATEAADQSGSLSHRANVFRSRSTKLITYKATEFCGVGWPI